MLYHNYKITALPEMAEIIMAFLGQLGFDTFETTEEGVDAYISEREHTETVQDEVKRLKSQFSFDYVIEQIAEQNWNAQWEANFKPVVVRDFCAVRASFHDPIPNVEFELVINPKMAFGTGHHETTFMVVDVMQGLNFERKRVFDYGCGTGILAILASKLGADMIDAVDIENESYLNTIENAEINDVHNINAFEGTIEVIDGNDYDVILANINRNVILATLPELRSKLATEVSPRFRDAAGQAKAGKLIISGFLKEDEGILRQACMDNDLTIEKVLTKNNWLCMLVY
ncbi:MAG: 50S ribosomal protein L11 methyltransferase [Saprospiraceae bacterium]